MLFRLAWRNLWRNRRRSLIIITSIVVGVAAVIFTDGFMRGFLKQMFENQLGMHTGHVQIHARGFRDNPVVQNYMTDAGPALEAVSSDARVAYFSRRALAYGLVSSASNSAGASIVGIDFEAEPNVTTIRSHLTEGSYLSGDPHEIVLSRRLAETLDIGLGDRVVAMASRLDGRVGSEMFRVVGLYQSPSLSFDRAYVYVPAGSVRNMLGVGDRTAEIVLLTHDIGTADALRDSLRDVLGERFEVLSYSDILPALVSQIDLAETSMLIFYGIIGLAMVFGVINTLLMSVFERIQEFGVLKAVGMKNGTLFALIILEAFGLGAVGSVLGGLLGLVQYAYFLHSGMNLGVFSDGLAQWGLAAVIHPDLTVAGVVNGMLIILLICVLAAAYPAARAVRLEPISAIRHV